MAKVIAELEGRDTELPAVYETIDHLIQTSFSDLPDPEAQAVLQFSYAGYRVTRSR